MEMITTTSTTITTTTITNFTTAVIVLHRVLELSSVLPSGA
jgi:hypothetical protein